MTVTGPNADSASKTRFEKVDCLICGGEQSRTVLSVQDRFSLPAGETFSIVECCVCHLRFLNPRPTRESIDKYYRAAAYQPFLSARASLGLLDRIYAFVRKFTLASKRRKIERLKRPGRVLDVGCGTGEFLHEMKAHGWQVDGHEKDPRAAQFAQQTYGLAISTDDLASKNHLKKSYDIVTLWHVLEHVHNPLEILGILRELLKDDGYALVAMPNISSIDARFYDANWVALDAPRHLYHFTEETFSRLLQKADLRIFRVRQMPLDAFYNCLLSERNLLIVGRRTLLLPLYMIRAFLVASLSTVFSCRLRRPKRGLGSSLLYFIQKSEKSHEDVEPISEDGT